MIKSFRHRGLKRFYERGDRSQIPPDLIDRIETRLARLDVA
jgi:proteic killer suppression protein